MNPKAKPLFVVSGVVSLLLTLSALTSLGRITQVTEELPMLAAVLSVVGYLVLSIGCFTKKGRALPGLVLLLIATILEVLPLGTYLLGGVSQTQMMLLLVHHGLSLLALILLLAMTGNRFRGFAVALPAILLVLSVVVLVLRYEILSASTVDLLNIIRSLVPSYILPLLLYILLPLALSTAKKPQQTPYTAPVTYPPYGPNGYGSNGTYGQPPVQPTYQTPQPQQPTQPVRQSDAPDPDAQEQLELYKHMLHKGLVSQEEYDQKRQQLGQ